MVLTGPRTRFPLASVSKKQSSVATSTAEAEITALMHLTRFSVLPASVLWDTLLKRQVDINVFEDNRSVLYIVSTGRNRTLRHFERTHRVAIAWLNEIYVKHPYVRWFFANSKDMLADIFTKHFVDKALFERLRASVGIAYSLDQVVEATSHLTKDRSTFNPQSHERPRLDLSDPGCVSSNASGNLPAEVAQHAILSLD